MTTIPANFRNAIAAQGHVLNLGRGQQVHATDDSGAGILGITSGRLEVHVQSDPDAPTLTDILRPGDWVGEINASDSQRCHVSIIARVETHDCGTLVPKCCASPQTTRRHGCIFRNWRPATSSGRST